jgi:8-oxo-dGTP diphosphatase
MKTRTEVSAGGVIYRAEGGQTEVCLIATRGYEAWQLPKGLIERGEPTEDAALREVAEETGLRGEIVAPLDKIEYYYVWDDGEERVRIHKLVYFFLMRYVGGSTEEHDDEVDEARWYPIAEALRALTYENERRVVSQAPQRMPAPSS